MICFKHRLTIQLKWDKKSWFFFFFRFFITTAVWKKRMICEFGSLTFDKLATVVFKCRIKYDLQRVTSHCHCIFNNYVNKARFYARSSVDRFQLFWQNFHWTGFRSMHDFGFKQKISDTKRLRFRDWNKSWKRDVNLLYFDLYLYCSDVCSFNISFFISVIIAM